MPIKILILSNKRERPCKAANLEDIEVTENRSWESLAMVRSKSDDGDIQAREFLEIGKNHRDMVDSDGQKYVAREWIIINWVAHVYSLDELLDILIETGGSLQYDKHNVAPWRIWMQFGPD